MLNQRDKDLDFGNKINLVGNLYFAAEELNIEWLSKKTYNQSIEYFLGEKNSKLIGKEYECINKETFAIKSNALDLIVRDRFDSVCQLAKNEDSILLSFNFFELVESKELHLRFCIDLNDQYLIHQIYLFDKGVLSIGSLFSSFSCFDTPTAIVLKNCKKDSLESVFICDFKKLLDLPVVRSFLPMDSARKNKELCSDYVSNWIVKQLLTEPDTYVTVLKSRRTKSTTSQYETIDIKDKCRFDEDITSTKSQLPIAKQ